MKFNEWESLDHFGPEEFDHPAMMEEKLVWSLEMLRRAIGLPIYISSDYRPSSTTSHGRGRAVDITDDKDSDGISGRWTYKVVTAALALGFTRIGIYNKHVHLDMDPASPQEVIWGGASS
jgi:hypothetical protein